MRTHEVMQIHTKAFRQGEIVMLTLPDNIVLPYDKLKKVRNNVIREGEKSGHMHEVVNGQLYMFPDGNMVIDAGKGGAEIKHPEHTTIKLPEGKHAVKIQETYNPATGARSSVKD